MTSFNHHHRHHLHSSAGQNGSTNFTGIKLKFVQIVYFWIDDGKQNQLMMMMMPTMICIWFFLEI